MKTRVEKDIAEKNPHQNQAYTVLKRVFVEIPEVAAEIVDLAHQICACHASDIFLAPLKVSLRLHKCASRWTRGRVVRMEQSSFDL